MCQFFVQQFDQYFEYSKTEPVINKIILKIIGISKFINHAEKH